MSDFSFVNQVPWQSVLLAAGLIFLVVAAWTWFEHKSDPARGTIDSPDATAFLKGSCGDAMKISLRFSGDRVVEAKYWTDGCRMSSACGAAAANLALHKTPEEIADVDYAAIEKEVGVLPEEDFHCATLAAGTLQEALKMYLVGDGEGSSYSRDESRRHIAEGRLD
jgi:nitrogen fixation protein NifU and related proteins